MFHRVNPTQMQQQVSMQRLCKGRQNINNLRKRAHASRVTYGMKHAGRSVATCVHFVIRTKTCPNMSAVSTCRNPFLVNSHNAHATVFTNTADGRTPAPPKKPVYNDSPANANKQINFNHGFISWRDFWISQPSTTLTEEGAVRQRSRSTAGGRPADESATSSAAAAPAAALSSSTSPGARCAPSSCTAACSIWPVDLKAACVQATCLQLKKSTTPLEKWTRPHSQCSKQASLKKKGGAATIEQRDIST